jgi:hypothetical protein
MKTRSEQQIQTVLTILVPASSCLLATRGKLATRTNLRTGLVTN